jgi:L1 cell adhesion molecule like protein
MKNQLDDEKMKDKFTEEDRKVIADACKETLQWVEGNETAEATEYEAKQKELESKFNPIMMRVY